MKKFLTLITISIAILLTGCGSDNDKLKIGTIKYLNVTEEALANLYEKSLDTKYDNRHCEFIFFKNMTNLLVALEAGQIDEISTYESVANYLVMKNSNLEFTVNDPPLVDMFCCALLEEDKELKQEFDAAILKLTTDGTLTKLVKTYISDINHMNTPPVINLPTFYGEPTVKIALTSDLPMLDYIRPDGVPAGFNTALLAEISKLIKKNFVFVQVDSGARALALSSGKVDVIFWAVAPQSDNDLPFDYDKPDGVILTVPYFSDKIVHLKLRK